jgi:hypothetical protein
VAANAGSSTPTRGIVVLVSPASRTRQDRAVLQSHPGHLTFVAADKRAMVAAPSALHFMNSLQLNLGVRHPYRLFSY